MKANEVLTTITRMTLFTGNKEVSLRVLSLNQVKTFKISYISLDDNQISINCIDCKGNHEDDLNLIPRLT